MDYQAIAVSNLHFLNGNDKARLYQSLDTLGRVEDLSFDDICLALGRVYRAKTFVKERWLEENKKQADLGSKKGIRTVTCFSPDYPMLLRSSHEPAFLLWVKGILPESDTLCLSVVGTRRPSESARLAAFELGKDCANYHVCLVSGLAFGIDGAAHTGCNRYGGRSIAVLAGGLDSVSPRAHGKLAQEILNLGGALVSEYGPGTSTAAFRYLARNRIIAAWSPGTMVVEAPLKSGALSTAQHALDEGREVYVHPVSALSPVGEGTRKLVFEGARQISQVGEYIEQFARHR